MAHKPNYLNYMQMKRRGWTSAMIDALLPASEGEKRDKTWRRLEVVEAEKQPLFREMRRANDPAVLAKHAHTLLKQAWKAAQKEESPAWILAGYYHQALMARAVSLAKDRDVPDRQNIRWLQEFLALEGLRDIRDLEPACKPLGYACAWLGACADHPFAQEFLTRYPQVLFHIAQQAINEFIRAQPEANVEAMLRWPKLPVNRLFRKGLGNLWSVWYVPQGIRTSLQLLTSLNPKDAYPEARAMQRRFVLHIGGTNTGKTYAGFQRLKAVGSGVYLAPLRLLALEAQETLLDAGVACSLSTGEEEDVRSGDTHMASTVEKLALGKRYEVAVIDECQMIADSHRGYAWTRAILGVLAPEIHLCAAPEAEGLLVRIIKSCGDSYTIERHQRATPLHCMTYPLDPRYVQPGDALITFTKKSVLLLAEELRRGGKEPAIIYGALPYATRRKQIDRFARGELRYIVSTDAIGMGMNLPIRRVIFMETEKFDGVRRRKLRPEEIRQIAGRAGRRGMYATGYVGAVRELDFIKAGMEAPIEPLEYGVVGFSELILQTEFDLLEVLREWNRIPTVEPYRKLNVSRYISVLSKIRKVGFHLSRQQELQAASIPFDETVEALWDLFFQFLYHWQAWGDIDLPKPPEEEATLPQLELYCKKLDLYFSFAKAFDCPVEMDSLRYYREDSADRINEILLHQLQSNLRFCAICGKAMPAKRRARICKDCFKEITKNKSEI